MDSPAGRPLSAHAADPRRTIGALAAERARRAGRKLTHLQAWALERAGEGHTNRAAVALANKLARIAWAVWRHGPSFDGNHALQLAAA